MGDRGVPGAQDRLAPDRRLRLREWDGGGPPVVCWAGLNLSADAHFDTAGPLLAERFGLHVEAVEPPGWTTPPLEPAEYRPTALARLLAPLLAPGAAFLGWSWGASIGVHLGALDPPGLRALVLLDGGFIDLQDEDGFRERPLDELVEALRIDVAKLQPPPAVAPEAIAAAWHGVSVERPSAALASIGCPVLLVAATETLARFGDGPLERFRAAVPGAQVRIIESGHDLLADALDETVEAVGTFLSGVSSR